MLNSATLPVKERRSCTEIRRIDTGKIEQLLQSGTVETCQRAIFDFFDEIGFRMIQSLPMRLYVVMDVYFLASGFAKSVGISQEEFVNRFGRIDDLEKRLSVTHIEYFGEMIAQCIRWRIAFTQPSGSRAIARAKGYIDAHFSQEDLSLCSVAAAMNFSPTYFCMLFHRETGVPFNDYLTATRLRKAKTLLCSTSKLVCEIAEAVGYRDYRYFTQIFKKHTGMTPRAFRAQGKAEKLASAGVRVTAHTGCSE